MSKLSWRVQGVRLALAVYVLAIFLGGGMKVDPNHVMSPLFSADKLLHGLVFAAFVPLLWAGLGGQVVGRVPRIAWAAGLSGTVGGLLELYQLALPHRSAEWLDFVADSVGAALAGAVLLVLAPRPAA